MLYSEITGNGQKTIIFIHGNSQSLHTWDKVIQHPWLTDYTRIMVDLPGHGRSFSSTNPEADYSAQGLALHLREFLEQYSDRSYVLVGTSLGTSIISGMNPFPSACKGAFLSGAMLSSKNITVKDMVQPGRSVAAAFKADATDEEIDELTDNFIFRADKAVKDHYKSVYRSTDPNLRAYLGKSLSKPPEIDKIANLTAAGIPVAVVYGQQERIVQTDYLKRTELPLWKNQIFKIQDAGHCAELDQPSAMARLISEFTENCL
ncbi:alpha/beta hydrolase [Mucilaginibacter sp. BJC16-A38]|uniref:alpha/beta fold hydrolase n=1 Tax=Mucilaginibacter phenanthrenivorans TaxID=1234842 RepID=UPI002158960D|nr:alpha/beta hydrolase [Mucilaginibacter phenanthrenivorans]MCR8557332.1 alpha/beta hydrolase [Mucilaginibacter phenanthrenivorans]